jgi:hypothetical protein
VRRCVLYAAAALIAIGTTAGGLPADDGEATRFDEHFEEGALRLDVVHTGSRNGEVIGLRRVILEPIWSGSRSARPDTSGMGEYRLDVRIGATGTLVYSQGFSSLFREWVTTDEAALVERAFEETYEIPLPKTAVDVEVAARGGTGETRTVFRATIDPHSPAIGRPHTLSNLVVRDIVIAGEPSDKVDLLIVGDGYTTAEADKFERDCDHIVREFFDVEPLRSYADRFNVRAVHLPSGESGVDEPRKGIFRDTPFGMSFNTFGSARYCMTESVWAVHDAASGIPHDAVLLMANSSRYGGGAIFNFYTAFVSDNEYDDYLCVHEFGHGFAGLADEYFDSQVSYNEFYPRGVEPWEPNITALLDPERLKWGRLVTPGTPIPTPADPRYHGDVGAFEGAGYAAEGLFRPAVDCKMFSKANRAFCPVCSRALVEAIRRYAPE